MCISTLNEEAKESGWRYWLSVLLKGFDTVVFEFSSCDFYETLVSDGTPFPPGHPPPGWMPPPPNNFGSPVGPYPPFMPPIPPWTNEGSSMPVAPQPPLQLPQPHYSPHTDEPEQEEEEGGEVGFQFLFHLLLNRDDPILIDERVFSSTSFPKRGK